MILKDIHEKKIKGRGIITNPGNRFERLHVEEFKSDEMFGEMEILENNKIQTFFYKDESKSIISCNESNDIDFNYSFNPYRGCEHGCVYCYARPSHEYLGFSSGLDFETKIMIKENAPLLLRKFLSSKNYKPDVIMFSGNTDCYQPIERKLEITRKSLAVCAAFNNPVSIVTKSALILRDMDILKEMAKINIVSVMISITSLDDILARAMEPRASSPLIKLAAIEQLAKNNIPVGISIAPVIPGLTESGMPKILKEASIRGASFAGYTILRLPYAVKEMFVEWLNTQFPAKSKKVVNKIKEVRNGKLNRSDFNTRFTGEGERAEMINNLFNISCKKYGLNISGMKLSVNDFVRTKASQLELF